MSKDQSYCFSNGGIVKEVEKWFYSGEPIEIVSFYKYLGVYFTPKLIWSKTKEVLALQASKAVNRIFHFQRQFGYFPVNDIFRLFDSIVKPILCYGSEIWGYEYSKTIEKIHIQFCKKFVGLHQNTADYFALSECGRYPLAVTYMSNSVKYWAKVVQMPDHRYPKQCYIMLRSLTEAGKVTWASHIRTLLFMYGFGYVWEANTVGDSISFVNMFKQRIKDCFLQQWHTDINESPKSLHYKHFKLILEMESYLTVDLPYVNRKVLANFRCSSHSLMIEKGRHQNIERQYRVCQLCLKRNVYVVEDEFHFFYVCPFYNEMRQIYFKPQWNKTATINSFYSVMSKKDKELLFATSRFLLSAFAYRNELLNGET